MNWELLTQDNEELLYELSDAGEGNRIVLFHDDCYFSLEEMGASIHTLAKMEQYYYYVVPKLVVKKLKLLPIKD